MLPLVGRQFLFGMFGTVPANRLQLTGMAGVLQTGSAYRHGRGPPDRLTFSCIRQEDDLPW